MPFSLLLAVALAGPDLRLEVTRQSLTATHHRYRQYIDGRPVVGGEVNVTVRGDGRRQETRNLAVEVERPAAVPRGEMVWLNAGGVARMVRREIDGHTVRYVDIDRGVALRTDVLSFPAKPGLVFDPNPVTRLNAPGLADEADSASAVPEGAYSEVQIEADESGPLGGPAIQIADFQGPFIAPVDGSGPLIFDRSESGFEDVNAYFHIDRSQRRLQSFGFVGPRAIAPYAIETDTHAAGGADDSFFTASVLEAGKGRLHFGEGGTDDAEDSDLLLHEYAHAIHEWISPGTFLGAFGSEARAVSEGFGDYWAFSANYAAARASGRDPHCIADWDARCWNDPSSERCAYPQGSDCLRRTDSTKTMADYIHGDNSGTEHRNGEIWSAALTDIFMALTQRYGIDSGRRAADMLAVESLFGTPPNATFATVARQLMAADQYLFAGTNRDVICAAMTERGILSDCLIAPRGEFTVYPGSGSGTIVPDNDPNGVALSAFIFDTRAIERVTVSVDIRHRGRGELRVELIAPDGTVVQLHQPNPERAPDLITTFGRDSLPVDSLDVFRGRSAAGEWRLRVADVAFADVATVVFWSLNIQFEGAAPSPHRPEWNIHSYSAVVPVVGHAPGANGTFFRTDLRLAAGSEPSSATLVFTPSGRDGREDFAAVRIDLPAGRAVAIDDLVLRLFSSGGLGQLEILSSTPLSASTRTWTAGEAGTFGFSLPPSSRFVAITSAEPQYIGGLRTTSVFRTNLGFAEAHGQPVRVHVRLRSASATESFSIDLPPHSHAQVPVDFQADPFVAEVRVEGAGAVIAYGAVVDNGSGDPMVIPAVRAGTSSTFPAISSPGANGTNWRTEVTIVSVDAVRGQSTHTYFAGGDPGVRQEIEADFLRVEDAVASWFERPNTIGAVNSMLPPNLVVTARVWTDGPGGTYGQVVTGSGGWTILHIENSDAYRTNIGFHSISGGSVRATLLDADGRVVNTYLVELQPFQLVQFPITDRIVNGAVRIEALFDVSAYGSLVDNRTGDPTFIPAQ